MSYSQKLMTFVRIQLNLIVRKLSDQIFTNLFQGSHQVFDIIFDCKRGIIICIANKVGCLEYQEQVTHKNIEQKTIQDSVIVEFYQGPWSLVLSSTVKEVLSSVQLIKQTVLNTKNMSHIKIQNKRQSRMAPCGTPD